MARRGLAALLALAALGLAPETARASCPEWFSNYEAMGPPGVTTARVSIRALQDCSVTGATGMPCWPSGDTPPGNNRTIRLRYWPAANGITNGDAFLPSANGHTLDFAEHYDFDLTGLTGDTEYKYRVECKVGNAWQARPSHKFKTLPSTAAAFTFVVQSDSHIVQMWKRTPCGSVASVTDDARAWLQYNATAKAIASESTARFVIDTGDTVMMNGASGQSCMTPFGATGGQKFSGSTSDTLRPSRADARYWVMLRNFRPWISSKSFVYSLGNHDGEVSFESDAVGGYYFTGDRVIARAARHLALGNPLDLYPLDETNDCTGGTCLDDGSYYTFCAGPTTADVNEFNVCTYAQFWVLNNFADTSRAGSTAADTCWNGNGLCPESPDDWTPGPAQLAWFKNSVSRSHAKYKIVLSHHLFGGVSPANADKVGLAYAYARGNTLAVEGRICCATRNGDGTCATGSGVACDYDYATTGTLRQRSGDEGCGLSQACACNGGLSGSVWRCRSCPGTTSAQETCSDLDSTKTVEGMSGVALKNYPFQGTQKALQRILERSLDQGGSAVWFFGHDHVTMWDQKRSYDGNGSHVWYAVTSQGSEKGSPDWELNGSGDYTDLYDLDRDGVSDTHQQTGSFGSPPAYPTTGLDADGQGTNRRGYWLVTVSPSTGITSDFIQTRCGTTSGIACWGDWANQVSSGKTFTTGAPDSQTVIFATDYEYLYGCADSVWPNSEQNSSTGSTCSCDSDAAALGLDGLHAGYCATASGVASYRRDSISGMPTSFFVDLLFTAGVISSPSATNSVIFRTSGSVNATASIRATGTGSTVYTLFPRCQSGANGTASPTLTVGTVYKMRVIVNATDDSVRLLLDPQEGSWGAGQLSDHSCDGTTAWTPGGITIAAGQTAFKPAYDDLAICSGSPIVGRKCED